MRTPHVESLRSPVAPRGVEAVAQDMPPRPHGKYSIVQYYSKVFPIISFLSFNVNLLRPVCVLVGSSCLLVT